MGEISPLLYERQQLSKGWVSRSWCFNCFNLCVAQWHFSQNAVQRPGLSSLLLSWDWANSRKLCPFAWPSYADGFTVGSRDKPSPATFYLPLFWEGGDGQEPIQEHRCPSTVLQSLSVLQGKMASLHPMGSSQRVWRGLVICYFVYSGEMHVNYWVTFASRKEIDGLGVM